MFKYSFLDLLRKMRLSGFLSKSVITLSSVESLVLLAQFFTLTKCLNFGITRTNFYLPAKLRGDKNCPLKVDEVPKALTLLR